jgi:hypothetical protein
MAKWGSRWIADLFILEDGPMFKSYEAIYDQGRLRWLQDEPGEIGEARVIVTVLPPEYAQDAQGDPPTVAPEPPHPVPEPNGSELARLARRLGQGDVASRFGDPVEWQRDQRRDRPLPGREE